MLQRLRNWWQNYRFSRKVKRLYPEAIRKRLAKTHPKELAAMTGQDIVNISFTMVMKMQMEMAEKALPWWSCHKRHRPAPEPNDVTEC